MSSIWMTTRAQRTDSQRLASFNENLERTLDNIDLNTDRAAWFRFCEWVHSFHDVDTSALVKFDDFAAFEKNGEVELPLKYLESIKDLWIKWSKAVEADLLSNKSIL